ncbi:hypothetical protein [Ochrobactrum chromiisoli]|uniref:YARHG domain-containing protein n=1 Tax=Ochrobactrum chromiisoli TaxID=2993941 RepID=A0ABT3QKX9_9HYPH|nr:hypothetical protein [Ochrobactrum chromiisoli]MCX2696231.1 hypothetical protein [Ochrobactrum chromiisoli]
MRTIALSIVALFASVSASYADFQCPAGQPAWHAQNKKNADFYLYGTKGFDWESKLYLERWDKGSLTWRVSPERTCSNGVSTCYMLFPKLEEYRDETKKEDDRLSVSYEMISDDQDENRYIVLAALTQSAWYAGGIDVERFNKPETEEERVIAPNVYTKMNCGEHGKKLVFLNAAKIGINKAKIAPDDIVSARLSGKMKSMYDCSPEFRSACLDMLYKTDDYIKQHKDEYEINEWGEWYDMAPDDKGRNEYWADQHRQAAKEGYNLFTNAELQEAAGVNFQKK